MTRAITREEILSMPAGRELDELVQQAIDPEGKNYFPTHWSKGPFSYDLDGNEIQWRPSTKIADAWEAVEKMRREHVHISIHWMDGKYTAEIIEVDPEEGYKYLGQYIDADTAPEAICKAALLSLLKED